MRDKQFILDRINEVDGCWEWQKALSAAGYGVTSYPGGKYCRAHRLSYEVFVGPIGDLNVLHTCDNRKCVRPSHLYLGTHADNTRDYLERERQCKGEDVHTAKLNEELARKIYHEQGKHQTIADKYGIHKSTVSHIKTGRSWKHANN